MRKHSFIAIAAGAVLATGGWANAQSDACRQSAFLFAKMAVASINCNFPASKSLAMFGDTATHFCGKGPPSAWPGSKAGAMTFFDEVKKQGKAAVCARIGGEMIGLENSKIPGQPGNGSLSNEAKHATGQRGHFSIDEVENLIAEETAAYHACRGGGTPEAAAACDLKDRLEKRLTAAGCVFVPTPTEAHNGGYYKNCGRRHGSN